MGIDRLSGDIVQVPDESRECLDLLSRYRHEVVVISRKSCSQGRVRRLADLNRGSFRWVEAVTMYLPALSRRCVGACGQSGISGGVHVRPLERQSGI